MTEAIKRWSESKRVLIVATSLALVGVITITFTVIFVLHAQRCFAHWGNGVTTRTQNILDASQAKNNAEDEFIRSLASMNRAKELAAYNAYIAASDAYKKKQSENPPPPSPLNCVTTILD